MKKNLVIITIDSLRADGIGFTQHRYGDKKSKPIKTPNLDAFCKKGTWYSNAYSTNTYTTAAHASLFTGQYPFQHGIRAFFNFDQQLNPDSYTLAEVLAGSGFQTFFYSDVPELFSEMNIWRGFRVKTHGKLNWLWNSVEELKKERNFIFIHLFDVHEPYLFIEDKSEKESINEDYFDAISDLQKKLGIKKKKNLKKNPHDSFKQVREKSRELELSDYEHLKALYDKGVEKFDKLRLPKILERLDSIGISEKVSQIVFLSDHGEGYTEYGNTQFLAHGGGDLTESVSRIFLATNNPANKPQQVSDLFSIAFINSLSRDSLGLDAPTHPYISFKNRFGPKKDFVYAESFIYSSDGDAPGMTDKGTWLARLNIDQKKSVLSVLRSRVLINETNKLVISGNPEMLQTVDFSDKDISSFINLTFQTILCRQPDNEAVKQFKTQLAKGLLSKKDYISVLFNSDEKRLKPTVAKYTAKNMWDQRNLYMHYAYKNELLWLLNKSSLEKHKPYKRDDLKNILQ